MPVKSFVESPLIISQGFKKSYTSIYKNTAFSFLMFAEFPSVFIDNIYIVWWCSLHILIIFLEHQNALSIFGKNKEHSFYMFGQVPSLFIWNETCLRKSPKDSYSHGMFHSNSVKTFIRFRYFGTVFVRKKCFRN